MAIRRDCLAVVLGSLLTAAAMAAPPPKKSPSPKRTSPTPASTTPVPAETPGGAALGSSAPCTAPAHRQFDFWLGEWDVTGADGKKTGESEIVRIMNGCAIQENWSGSKDAHGTSFNLYDAPNKRWHQTWVDDAGGLLLLNGELRDGRMVLIGRRPSEKQKGTMITHRITWTPVSADRVRQHWEASPNEGRSWQVVFDGTYVRKKSS